MIVLTTPEREVIVLSSPAREPERAEILAVLFVIFVFAVSRAPESEVTVAVRELSPHESVAIAVVRTETTPERVEIVPLVVIRLEFVVSRLPESEMTVLVRVEREPERVLIVVERETREPERVEIVELIPVTVPERAFCDRESVK